jgi:thiosulfate dehydrogenase [quinone] large subunit
MYEDLETRSPAPPETRSRPRREPPGRSWKSPLSPALALLPLRLFLGVTFVYAGIQKLSDPGFLHPGAPTYIGTQLEGFAKGTPGGFVLHAFALPDPAVAGVGVALAEIAIGLLATAGFYTRLAAAGGFALNLLLFLTASWHTTPYFLGPDLVFTFAWLPFVLTGSQGQPALDNVVEHASAALARRVRLQPIQGPGGLDAEPASTRRALLAEFAGMAVAVAGVAALARGPYSAPKSLAASVPGGTAGGTPPAGGAGGGTAPAGAANGGGSAGAGGARGVPAGAVRLGSGRQLPRGAAATYGDPSTGEPDILIRQSNGNLKAFSAVCTHAGCTVGYEGGTIVCPCHGAQYSAETGQVIGGPAPEGLAPKQVVEKGGQIYAVAS